MQLVIGRIGKAHGIRGELNVTIMTDEPEERFAVGNVLATDPADRGPLTVTAMRPASNRLVVAFAEVPDRNVAETLSGTLLVIDSGDLPPIDDDDEFYDHELEGMSVVTADGTPLGTVAEIIHGSAGDTLVVKGTVSGKKREVLIPFVLEIVPTIEREARLITVNPPEGLLEL